jgi:hypothetical protein
MGRQAKMPTLTLKLQNKTFAKYALKKGAALTIGRRENNDIVIDDPAVSGHHAKIDFLGDRLILTDLKSKNGSFVNEQLVHSHWLKDADVITIGEHALVLNDDSKKQAAVEASDDFDETQAMNNTQHRKMMIKSNPTKSINVVRFWDQNQNRGKVRNVEPLASDTADEDLQTEPVGILNYLDGGVGQIKLSNKITTIGTDPTSDIVIKGLLMDPTAATINRIPEGFCFNYIGGRPRPKINDEPVKESIFLEISDIIQIGSARLQFSIEEQPKTTLIDED